MTRVALVTGGTKGIGAAIAKKLKSKKYSVVATYHGDDAAAEAFKKATGIEVYKFDVGDFAACEKAIAKIEKEVGPIDVLVNNAGITKDGFLHKMDKGAWDAVMSTNLNSCFNTCRSIIPGMRDRGFGRIINISSINGQKGQMGQVNYSAAKAGMLGFTKALALENANKKITVNAICPGYIETEMTSAMRNDILEAIIRQIPVGRMGKPEEIADMVAFLAADENAFITGATMTVNGGQYMAA